MKFQVEHCHLSFPILVIFRPGPYFCNRPWSAWDETESSRAPWSQEPPPETQPTTARRWRPDRTTAKFDEPVQAAVDYGPVEVRSTPELQQQAGSALQFHITHGPSKNKGRGRRSGPCSSPSHTNRLTLPTTDTILARGRRAATAEAAMASPLHVLGS